MSLLITIAGVVGFCFVMADFWENLPREKEPALRRWFRNWMIRGLIGPFAIWMLFNSALFDSFPPLIPQIEIAKLNGQWLEAVIDAATFGLFIIGTYWAAATTIWLVSALAQWTAERQRFRNHFLFWSGFLFPLACAMIFMLGWRFAGLAVVIWLMPIAQRGLHFPKDEKIPPIYSRAIAAMQFDRHESAEALVLAELERCQDDFDGWMMLAHLYANHFDDLPGAEKLIHETCEQPSTTSSQTAVAYHKLADWQLKIAHDPGAARRSLEEICRRYPKSHLDKMARLRIRQLPPTREALEAARPGIKLPRRRRDLDEPASAPTLSRPQAANQARQEIERLKTNPDDIPARERLARLFAEELENADLGLEQLELMLGMASPPPGKPAEWLALMAAWQVRYKQDQGAARKILERLVRLYPQSPQAFSAQRRLSMFDIESKLRAKNRGETGAC